MLQIAAQGTGSELGIKGRLHHLALGGLCQAAAKLLLQQALVELLHLQIYDLEDILLGEGLIEHNLIQPVQELRAEALLQQNIHLLPGGLMTWNEWYIDEDGNYTPAWCYCMLKCI